MPSIRQYALLCATGAALGSTAVSAVNFCPASWAAEQSHAVNTAGAADDAGTGCVIGQDATSSTVFSIDLRDVPSAPGSQSAVSFESGTVRANSLLRVLMPSESASAAKIPLRVTISGSTFEEGAGLHIVGSLPPGSVVTVSGNTFATIASEEAPSWFVGTFSAIAIYAPTEDVLLRLNAGSQLVVTDNVITGEGDLTTGFSTVGISWRGGVSYGDGASALISRNSVTLACSSPLSPTIDVQACVLGMHLAANQFFEGNAASAQITDNTFAITEGLIAALPAVSSGAGVIGNTFSFSGNSGSANTTGALGSDAVSLGAVTAGSDTVVAFEENTFTIVGTTACSIGLALAIPVEAIFGGGGLDNPTLMSGNAALVLSRNAITTTGCDCQLLLRRDHTVSDSARMQIDENTLLRTDQGSGGAAVEIRNGLTLQGSGALSLAGNTFDSTPRPADAAQLIGFGLSTTSSASGAVGSIRACGNSLYGAQLASDEQVRARCVEAVAGIVVSSGCFGALPTETVQNTQPTTVADSTTASGVTAIEPEVLPPATPDRNTAGDSEVIFGLIRNDKPTTPATTTAPSFAIGRSFGPMMFSAAVVVAVVLSGAL